LELPPVVSSNDGLVHKGSVRGEVLEHGNRVAILVLVEQQAVSI